MAHYVQMMFTLCDGDLTKAGIHVDEKANVKEMATEELGELLEKQVYAKIHDYSKMFTPPEEAEKYLEQMLSDLARDVALRTEEKNK